jgi:hypothetical protein
MATNNMTASQAQAIVNAFNSAPTQQKYSITIQGNGGQATTDFTFSLQKPNLLSEALSALNPFNWASTTGEVWTGLTTGNADVVLNTSSPLLISNTQNIILDSQHPFGTESLDIGTPENFFDFLYHQVNNAVTITAKLYYCSPSGALVGIKATPNTGLLSSAGYSVVSAGGWTPTGGNQTIGGNVDGFLQVGTLDPQILALAQSANSPDNPSEVYGIGNGNNSSSNVVTTVTQASTTSSQSTYTPQQTYVPSNQVVSSPSISGSSTYGMSDTGTGGGTTIPSSTYSPTYTNSTSSSPTSSSSSSSSKTTKDLLLGIVGLSIVGVGLFLFMKEYKKPKH